MPKQFILIMTDTQRKDMLGCYGNADMKTPCLDGLAAEGIRFERGYTAQPVCGPARSAIFTGLFPHTNGCIANCIGLESTVKTIGQRLRHEGIHTAYIGKWHLDGGDYFGKGVCPDGWDASCWYDMRCYLDELTEEERIRSRSCGTILDGEGWKEESTYAFRCSSRAEAFLKEHGTEDFFLVVSYDEPHDPFLAPRRFAEAYEDYELPDRENYYDTLEDKPSHHRAWAREALTEDRSMGCHRKEPLYLGCNTFVDSQIGRVLEAYRAFAPGALVLYTSDHGDMLGSHRLEAKGPAVYEEITNIPFILAGKPVREKGISNAHPVSHVDIVPTILEYFQAFSYEMLPGKSLLGLLENGRAKVNDFIFMEFGRYEVAHDYFGGFQPLRGIFDGRYKLAVNLLSEDELYDLQEDPGEMHNLITEPGYFAIRDRLHDRLLSWMNETRDPFRGYAFRCRPWRTDAEPPSWNDSGITRQKKPDYDETAELRYVDGLPAVPESYQVIGG